MRPILRRLAILEAKVAKGSRQEPEHPQIDYEALRAALADHPAPPEPPRPTGAAAVSHLRQKIEDLERLATTAPEPDVPGQTNYSRLRRLLLLPSLPRLRQALLEAELLAGCQAAGLGMR